MKRGAARKGAQPRRKSFQVYSNQYGVRTFLGLYATAREAAVAYARHVGEASAPAAPGMGAAAATQVAMEVSAAAHADGAEVAEID